MDIKNQVFKQPIAF